MQQGAISVTCNYLSIASVAKDKDLFSKKSGVAFIPCVAMTSCIVYYCEQKKSTFGVF